MASLLELAASRENVAIGSEHIEVRGLSARTVADLLRRFPVAASILVGSGATAENIIATAPGAIEAIIAAGCGSPGEVGEDAAATLPLEAQADLLAAILRLTLPSGIGPFVARLTALGGGLVSTPSSEKTSQSESTSSLDPGTP